MGIAQGVVGLGKTIFGASQRNRAERERDRLLEQQPEFETPQSVEELSSLYGQHLENVRRRDGLPGQAQIESNLRESTATGIQNVRETARTSAEALGATTDIVGKEIESLQQLEIEAARQKAKQELNAMQMYGQALGQEAQYEQQEFMYNEYMPWKTRVAQAQAEYAGGQQTMQSGISDLVSGATQFGISEFTGGGNQVNQSNEFMANQADFNARMQAGQYDIPNYLNY
jgi:hypothetical protein